MKTLSEFMGRVAVPLVTAFRGDEELHLDATAELADYVVAKGYCDSLILTGTTGEFYALEDEERIAIWNAVLGAVGKRAPLVAGVGAPDTRRAVKLAIKAERLGFEAIMVVLPYYSKPT